MMSRNITDPALANIAIPFANPGLLHKLTDPDAGDTLYVVTAQRPVRGFIKRQDLVDLSLLESAHGIAIRPNSDDVGVEVGSDKVILGKKGGLTLSPVDVSAERAPTAVRPVFNPEGWRKGQSEDFWTRQSELITAISAVEPAQRSLPRLDLAQFYMSRAMYHEAKSVTELMLSRSPQQGGERRADHACDREHPDRPAGAGPEGSRQSRDRQQPQFPALEGARLCAPGQMGGRAREIQERRIRHRLAAARHPAHRDDGRDARLARGEGLCRRLQAPRRDRGGRRVAGGCGPALPCCAAGSPRRSATTRTRSTTTNSRSPRTTGRRRPKPSSSRSRCGRSATRSARKTRCASSRRCR